MHFSLLVGHALNWCTLGGKERKKNYTLDLTKEVVSLSENTDRNI